MITEANPAEYSVAAQIHSVTQAAYTLEAERIGCADFPPLRESIDELRESPDRFLIFQQSGKMIGVLSFHRSAERVAITRLVVSPAHLRQGVATALLAELERRLPPEARLIVSTAQANTAAVLFYERCGFTINNVDRSAEGIPLLHCSKASDRHS